VPPVAKVEPITTARALRGPFDYLRPDGIGIGSVLVVPFGHRDVVGVVVGLADSSELPDDRLVAPRRVLDHDLPPELVELAGWIADEYCSPPARALALVSPPPGGRAKLTWWATATGQGADPPARAPTARQRALLAGLPRPAGGDLPALRRLEARGLVSLQQRATRRHVQHETVGARRAQPPLTADQARVLADL
jgi:primosomal protein N' (replication factor Y) (superfamily II helicase)